MVNEIYNFPFISVAKNEFFPMSSEVEIVLRLVNEHEDIQMVYGLPRQRNRLGRGC